MGRIRRTHHSSCCVPKLQILAFALNLDFSVSFTFTSKRFALVPITFVAFDSESDMLAIGTAGHNDDTKGGCLVHLLELDDAAKFPVLGTIAITFNFWYATNTAITLKFWYAQKLLVMSITSAKHSTKTRQSSWSDQGGYIWQHAPKTVTLPCVQKCDVFALTPFHLTSWFEY